MSKKNKEPRAQRPVTPFDKDILKGLCIALSLVLIFSVGNITGELTSKNNKVSTNDTVSVSDTAGDTPTEAPATQAPATQAPATEATQAPATQAPADTTAAVADTTAAQSDAPAQTGAPSSKAEIIALFNESANKIKTSASKVTRNYEDLQHNEDKLELPSALQAVGSGLISNFLKKDETPIDYTGADIKENYPVKKQDYVSKATEADLADATCTDDGTSYNITLKFNSATDPAVGTGVGGAFNIMDPNDVYSAASMVQSFSVDYYDAVIECKIDKATGNMTWARYTLPMVMSVQAKVIVTLDAKVGMTFIDDYSITY